MATGILTVIVAFVLLLLASIVAFILVKGLGKALSPGFLTTLPLADENPGISSEIFDSFYMLIVTLLISVPISLGAAIFLVEYAPDNWVTKAASTAIETLSSLPSIVVGMFGSLFFVVTLGWGISIIAGAMALTMFNIPILVRAIQQALQDVPRSQRDAALAMGLTRWETTRHVLLPAAMPAIVTGIVISAGRVFGDGSCTIFTSGSAAVNINFASANLSSPRNPWNIFRPAETLAVHIWKLKMEPTPGNDENRVGHRSRPYHLRAALQHPCARPGQGACQEDDERMMEDEKMTPTSGEGSALLYTKDVTVKYDYTHDGPAPNVALL